MWFIGVEVEQETTAPPPKKNPGSNPEINQKKVQRKQQTYRDSYPSLVLITCEDSNQFDLGEKAKH